MGVFLFLPLLTFFLSLGGILHFAVFRNKKGIDWVANNWAKTFLKFMNIHVRMSGEDRLPQQSCLVLFNHSSFLDIFALEALVPSIRFGAKIELFDIPVFGSAMRAYGILPIAREQKAKVIEVYRKSLEHLVPGEKYALAPEGKRNTRDDLLLPFKSGPFYFAIEARIPVVPTVILGACQLWPKNSFFPATQAWRSEITMEFLDPISPGSEKQPLMKKVREAMEKAI